MARIVDAMNLSAPRALEIPDNARLVIGRGDTCDIIIPADSVSRRHVAVTRCQNEIEIVDLESSNGTKLDGLLITKATWYEGQNLEVGPARFMLERHTPEQPTTASRPETTIDDDATEVRTPIVPQPASAVSAGCHEQSGRPDEPSQVSSTDTKHFEFGNAKHVHWFSPAFCLVMSVIFASIPGFGSTAALIESWFLWTPWLALGLIAGHKAYKVSKDRRPALVISAEGLYYRRFSSIPIPWSAVRAIGGAAAPRTTTGMVAGVVHYIAQIISLGKVRDLSTSLNIDVGPEWRRYRSVSNWYAPCHVALQLLVRQPPLAINLEHIDTSLQSVLDAIAQFRPDLVSAAVDFDATNDA